MSDTEKSRVRRARLLDGLRPYSMPRTRECCKRRIGGAVSILRTPEQSLQFTGLSTCGSQDCPICASKILARRAAEIMHACEEWRNEGCFVYLMTLTVRHAMGDDLKELRKGMASAYSDMWKGRAGVALVQQLRRVHHIKSIEVTIGKNGYHPHFHALLFVERELDDSDLLALKHAWSEQVQKKLGASFVPNEARGVTLEHSHRDNYIAKMGLEVAGITRKLAKNDNLTMWQVADAAAGGNRWARRVWSEYVRAMHGCRRQVWSQGAKRYFGIHHLSDLAIAERDIGAAQGPLYVAAIWDGRDWDRLSKHPYWVTRVVHAATGGVRALVELPRQLDWCEPGHLSQVRPPLPPIPSRRDSDERISVRGVTPDGRPRAERVPLAVSLMLDGSESAWFVRVRRTGGRPGRTVRLWRRHGSHEQAAIDYATHWRSRPGEWLCEVQQGLFGDPVCVQVSRTESGCVAVL